ncbi:MAG: 50S ribosomal protein L24 [Candidatus Bathyarchaeota archaeon]|jgi:large subunit ribosomal protein L24|nr:MAG: 50S ribosomal protein L24 [Candidatus Bathyarchaeota archaeon]
MKIRKPRTQRRNLFQAHAHTRRKHFSAPLSPDLKERYGANSFPLRVGDTVRVLRGDRRGFEGKITRVDRAKFRVFVEGVTREKVDGTAIQIPIHPSKAMIMDLDLSDKRRRETMDRKGIPSVKEVTTGEKAEKTEKKPRKERAIKKPRRKKKPKTLETRSQKQEKTSETKTRSGTKKKRRKSKAKKGAE